MKNSKLLLSCAVAGMLVGAQVAMADHHEEKKTEEGKNNCKSADGKNTCKGKKAVTEESHSCGANGCQGKTEEKKK